MARDDRRNDERHDRDRTPPANVTHGALRYVRSQRHLNGLDRGSPRGGRDDVGAFEQETWRGRDERMRAMHSGPSNATSGGSSAASGGGTPHFRRAPTRSQADQRVRHDVNEALTVHERVDASEIDVDVKDGVVTLSGTVSSRAEHREAEESLYEVPGVVDVINQLRVVPRAISAPFER
jgi:hypothetical protein